MRVCLHFGVFVYSFRGSNHKAPIFHMTLCWIRYKWRRTNTEAVGHLEQNPTSFP